MQLEIYNLIAEENHISVSLEAICDSYSSLLWDIEFYQCGCFEVYIAASPQNVSIFQRGRIVKRNLLFILIWVRKYLLACCLMFKLCY